MVGSVSRVVGAVEAVEGAGARVRRLFPTSSLPYLDPFVLLDEFWVDPTSGFPEHDHRGFEFVTYVLDGALRHRDSAGNEGVVPAGSVQRGTTGRGITHSEMPAELNSCHGLQLWVRLPRRLMGVEPGYQQLGAGAIPTSGEDGVRIRTIVGEASPLRLLTPVLYLDVEMREGGRFGMNLPEGFNALAYVLSGTLLVEGGGVPQHSAALLVLGSPFEALGRGKVRFILVAGRPHGEPIRLRGPFVE